MTNVQIDCFLAAARGGSIAAASKELFLSIQVVSQHILNLEKELSVRLFQRTHKGVRLTAEGEEFLKFAVRWVELYNSAMRSLEARYNDLARCLRIGISEYIDPVGQISGGIAAFAHEHESTDISGVQYRNQTIMQAVADGEIDVALMCDTQITAGGDFEILPFAKEDLRLYISHGPDLSGCSVESDEVRAVCARFPHLDAPYGMWSREQWREIARRMSVHLGLHFGQSYTMPNFRALVASANTLPCVVVCDARFGYLRDNAFLQSFPLNVQSNICCVCDKKNENPLIQAFYQHMKEYYR